MDEEEPTLETLRSVAEDIGADTGRAGPPDGLEALVELVRAAHRAGHSLDEITVAARLSFAHVCALLGVDPVPAERTRDGQVLWRFTTPPESG